MLTPAILVFNLAQILQQLDQYRHYPDFNNYLAYVFARAEQVPLEVRRSASNGRWVPGKLLFASPEARIPFVFYQ